MILSVSVNTMLALRDNPKRQPVSSSPHRIRMRSIPRPEDGQIAMLEWAHCRHLITTAALNRVSRCGDSESA